MKCAFSYLRSKNFENTACVYIYVTISIIDIISYFIEFRLLLPRSQTRIGESRPKLYLLSRNIPMFMFV